jgi:hypothetical protein
MAVSFGWLGMVDQNFRGTMPQIAFNMQVKICYSNFMPKVRSSAKWRSGCPLNASVEMLGDRWSLLILRDMMLRELRTYKEFLESFEGIATNILADRLRKLEAYGQGNRPRAGPHGNGPLGVRT